MSDFKKYIPKKHKEWSLLLKKFHNLIRDYNTPPIDVAYWYGERALTGFLSAAAWKMPDGWSLEEFTGLRRKVEGISGWELVPKNLLLKLKLFGLVIWRIIY